MTSFPNKAALQAAKVELAAAVARAWRQLPHELPSEILRAGQKLAEKRGADPHAFTVLAQAGLNGEIAKVDERLALADSALAAWHRVCGLSGKPIIYRAVRELAVLRDEDPLDAVTRIDSLAGEFGRSESEARKERDKAFQKAARKRRQDKEKADIARQKHRLEVRERNSL